MASPERSKQLLMKLSSFIFFFVGWLCVALTAQAQQFNYQWGRNFGGIGEDVVRAMSTDDAGNTYTTGYFTDVADYDPGEGVNELTSNGFFDVFVQKLDTDGNLVWVASVGGAFFDYGTGIETDAEGNVYVTGVYQETVDFDPSGETFELTSAGSEDIYVLKLDADGNFIWARGMGSPGYEEPTSVGVDENGAVYVSGYFSETGDYDPGEGEYLLESNGGQDAFVVRLDADGNLDWARNFGGDEQELSLGMDVATNGDLYLSGTFAGECNFNPNDTGEQIRTPVDSQDGYILKLNSLGEFVYVATFGGQGGDTSWDVAIDNDGNAFAAGGFNGTFAFGDAEFESQDNEDAFVVKVDVFGNIEWARAIHGTDFQNAYDVNTDPFGNVFIAGYFGGTADFDPSDEGVLELTRESTEPFDAFVCGLNSNGILIYAAQFGGSNFTEHHGVDTDGEGNVYLASAFQNTVDLTPDPEETENASVVDFRDNYVIKLNPAELSTGNDLPALTLGIYPNPARDRLTINMPATATPTAAWLCDAAGRVVGKVTLSGGENTVDVGKFPAGIYLVQASGYRPVRWAKL